MKKLSARQVSDIANAITTEDSVKKAAAAMIETPLDLIRCVLQRHEESVISIMRELTIEKQQLREALEALTTVSRCYLPDYDQHPAIHAADAVLAAVRP